MYNYLPWPSNMRTADHVLAMRIQEGAAGYGVYVMLLELLRDSESRQLVNNPKNLAFAINEPDTGLVQRVLSDYGLFSPGSDGTVFSPWLNQQLEEYDAKKAAAAEAGRRGAAKRYGRTIEKPKDSDSDPMATPLPPYKAPHGNNTNSMNKTDVTQSRSKLLGLTWEGMTGEDLFNLARGARSDIDDLTRQWVEGKQKELDRTKGRDKHNLRAVLEVADHFGLGQEVFIWLLKYTNMGEIDRPPLIKLLRIERECLESKFKPRFAAEYIICKLLES